MSLPISAGASTASNPFLRDNAPAGQSVFLEASPSIAWRTETSQAVLQGQVRVDHFLQDYDDDLSVRLGLDASHNVSETLSLRGHASVRSARANGLDILRGNAGPVSLDGLTGGPILSPIDIAFSGARSRTTTFEGGVGLSQRLNARVTLSADAATSLNRFGDSALRDSRVSSLTAVLNRAISERSRLTLSMDASTVDYLQRRDGDGIIIAPMVGWNVELSPATTLSVSGGASYVRVTDVAGSRDSSVSLAGRANICSRRKIGSFCARASRAAQPTAQGGLRPVTSIGISASARLNRLDQLSFDANYTLSPAGKQTIETGSELAQASGSYSRTVNDRLSAFVSPSVTKLFSNQTSPRTNFALRLGLRFIFGTVR